MKSVANLRLLAEWICQEKVMIRSPLEKMNYLGQEYQQAFAHNNMNKNSNSATKVSSLITNMKIWTKWYTFYSVQLRANECCPIYQFQAIRQNEECGESETSCMNLYDYEAHKKW